MKEITRISERKSEPYGGLGGQFWVSTANSQTIETLDLDHPVAHNSQSNERGTEEMSQTEV